MYSNTYNLFRISTLSKLNTCQYLKVKKYIFLKLIFLNIRKDLNLDPLAGFRISDTQSNYLPRQIVISWVPAPTNIIIGKPNYLSNVYSLIGHCSYVIQHFLKYLCYVQYIEQLKTAAQQQKCKCNRYVNQYSYSFLTIHIGTSW